MRRLRAIANSFHGGDDDQNGDESDDQNDDENDDQNDNSRQFKTRIFIIQQILATIVQRLKFKQIAINFW